MRIGREVPRGAGAGEEWLQRLPVIVLLAHHPDVFQGEPSIKFRCRDIGREGSRKHPGIGGKPQEPEKHHPWEADGVLVVHGFFQPATHKVVLWRIRIHSVEENVQIDDSHLRNASSRTISSSSRAAASASALSSATRGTPIEWTCSR